MSHRASRTAFFALVLLAAGSCNQPSLSQDRGARTTTRIVAAAQELAAPADAPLLAQSADRAVVQEIPVFENGQVARAIDIGALDTRNAFVIDLSDGWVPTLLRGDAEHESSYHDTYVALANERFESRGRAARDRYLELYGVLPSLDVLAGRLSHALTNTCPAPAIDGLGSTEASERRAAIASIQARLVCEGLLRAGYREGVLDGPTRAALAELEREHRIVGHGTPSQDTLAALARDSAELARLDLVRVLVERTMLDDGLLEDGSADALGALATTWTGPDGVRHEVPNLRREVETALSRAFGLETPSSALEFVVESGDLSAPKPHLVAFVGPTLPEYYDADMELSVEVDRGDVWYDFPFDAQGRAVAQPVASHPRLTLYTTYRGERIALATFATTIGGWHREIVNGAAEWKYKESPVGERVWTDIVAAPVWMPPPATPPSEILRRTVRGYRLNTDLTGPSYASAYGLVAAYHRRLAPGGVTPAGDEGIRTHGSVSYNSVGHGVSHGCHRLLNHEAVRLMSFVLAHRPHTALGEQAVAYHGSFTVDGQPVTVSLAHGGFELALARPLPVHVLAGHLAGRLAHAITTSIPEYDAVRGGYFRADGSEVQFADDGSPVTISAPTVTAPGPAPTPAVTVPAPLPVASLGLPAQG